MLCRLTRAVVVHESPMASTAFGTASSSGLFLSLVLYLGGVERTLQISGLGIIKICYGDCNCPLLNLVVYYSRSVTSDWT
jgi:hypothetical protein